ncbi:MAG: hypothetical protein C4524_02170 [Candidatus Zixiibacteriota bacterium]|nr:MAG: hypothetical protein C4524_02170 [candidate division Zixibacteria bacterium]
MVGKVPLIFLFLLLAAAIPPVHGQSPELTDAEHWQSAVEGYAQRDYGAAGQHAQRVIRRGNSTYESAAWLLLARSELRMDRLPSAQEAAERLISLYPHGRYASHAHYVLAEVAFRQERFFDCALQLLDAAQTTDDEPLHLLAREKLERLYELYLSDEQQGRFLAWVDHPEIMAELTAVRQGYRLPLKVGVVVQLSGPYGEEGQGLLAGIEHAVAEAMRRSRLAVELISRDSEGNVVEAVRAAHSLITEEGVIALIGDLAGQTSAAVAAVAAERGVPLIIPASADVGLSEIGDNVFQLMADYRREGEIAAAYAWETMGARRVAILAPDSEEGVQRVEGFRSEFEARGGRVTQAQWYYPETMDFRPQLEAIDREALALREPEPDTLQVAAEPQMESVAEVDSLMLEGDSTAVVYRYGPGLEYLDALYVPVQGEEMALLAPQIAAVSPYARLIGSATCLDLVRRESNRRYTEGMVFPAHFASATQPAVEGDFEDLYRERTGFPPDRWNVLGWDAFNFLAPALKRDGKLSPALVARRLAGTGVYRGARMEMHFPAGSRVNHALYILRYAGDSLEMLWHPRQVIENDAP